MGKKIAELLQRTVGRCETVGKADYNSSLNLRPKAGAYAVRVGLDGYSRYRETVFDSTGRVGFYHQKEWYRGDFFIELRLF